MRLHVANPAAGSAPYASGTIGRLDRPMPVSQRSGLEALCNCLLAAGAKPLVRPSSLHSCVFSPRMSRWDAVGIEKPDEGNPQSQDDKCSTNNHNVTPKSATADAGLHASSRGAQRQLSAVFKKKRQGPWLARSRPAYRPACRRTAEATGDEFCCIFKLIGIS